MSPAILATGKDLKKIKVYVGKDGQVHKGDIYGSDNGRRGADRVATGGEEEKKTKDK